MFRKNKISVFLVAMVMLLSVYYLNVPTNPGNPSEPEQEGEVENNIPDRDERLAASRMQIDSYRDSQRSDLYVILGNSTSSAEEKQNARTTLSEIETFSSKELSLEIDIISLSLGVSDSLVHVVGDEVSLTVVTPAGGSELTNKLFGMAKEEFGDHYVVSVNYLLPL